MQLTNKTALATFAVLALGIMAVSRPALTAVYSTPFHDVDNPARGAVHHNGQVILTPGTGSSAESFPYVVPAGQRLVIDTISARMYAPTGQGAVVDVDPAFPNVPVALYVPMGPNAAYGNGQDTAVGTAYVAGYAESGTTVKFFAQRIDPVGNGTGTVTVTVGWTGHLVTLP